LSSFPSSFLSDSIGGELASRVTMAKHFFGNVLAPRTVRLDVCLSRGIIRSPEADGLAALPHVSENPSFAARRTPLFAPTL
jgi:hypothetical protein